MTPFPGRSLIVETEVAGVYDLVNTFWITSCKVIVTGGFVTVIAKNLAGEKFVIEGAGAIDLLSALGEKVPTQPNPTN